MSDLENTENKSFMDSFAWNDKLKQNFVPAIVTLLISTIVVLWLQLQKSNDALLACKTQQAVEIERLKDAFIAHILEAERIKDEIQIQKEKLKEKSNGRKQLSTN